MIDIIPTFVRHSILGQSSRSWSKFVVRLLSGSNDPNQESVLRSSWILPIWLTLIGLLIAAALVAYLYASERGRINRWQRSVMGVIRWLILASVLWMLAAWTAQRFVTEKPELIIAFDRSQSMTTVDMPNSSGTNASEIEFSTDSNNQLTRWGKLSEALLSSNSQSLQEIESKYQLRGFSIGAEATAIGDTAEDIASAIGDALPDDQQSQIGDSIKQILLRQRGRSTSGLILLSDGITTSGISLQDAGQMAIEQSIPVYAIGVGQEFAQPDVRLAAVLMEESAYLGDEVQVSFQVLGSDLQESRTIVQLKDVETGQVLASESIVIGGANSRGEAKYLSFLANRPGKINIEIDIAAIPGERDISNNRQIRVVEVRDQAISVLLVQSDPTYEYRFLKNLLQRTRQPSNPDKTAFDLTCVLLEADAEWADQDPSGSRLLPISPEAIDKFSCIILGDIDPTGLPPAFQDALYQWVTRSGGGLMIISSGKHNLSALQSTTLAPLSPTLLETARSVPLADISPFRWNVTRLGETVLPLRLEADTAENNRLWQALPPLKWYSDPGAPKPAASVLAVNTDADGKGKSVPILITHFAGSGRVVLQATDETFRWLNFRGQDLYYQRYWVQMVRWLARGKNNRADMLADLTTDQEEYRPGESVYVEATIPTDAMNSEVAGDTKSIPNATAAITLQTESGRQTRIPLTSVSQSTNKFRAELKDLSPGAYRIEVSEPIFAEPPTAAFSVLAPPGELARLGAQTDDMQELAAMTGGKFSPLEDFAELLKNLPPPQNIRLQPLDSIPLWNRWPVVLWILGLLVAEWLLRRRFGLQ